MSNFAFRAFLRSLRLKFVFPSLLHSPFLLYSAQTVFRFKLFLNASFFYEALRFGVLKLAPHLQAENNTEIKIPKRLKRFRDFSSIEYDGIEYMTPDDFLDSLILEVPRERTFRRVINNHQLKKMLNSTPPFRKGSDKLFRQLGENGIISYAEYLFLITLLTKSEFAFNIAFLMFDEDENLQIDKNEFLLISFVIITSLTSGQVDQPDDASFWELDDTTMIQRSIINCVGLKDLNALLEKLFFESTSRYNNSSNLPVKNKRSTNETTILMHLFGRSGLNSLSLDQFKLFYNNLQKELIQIEFHEFARGKSEISTTDFAHLVLRYSKLHKKDHSIYIKRIYERSQLDDEGISLLQFEQFSMFLNNLEEFSKAVRLYTAANIPVSQSEFIRAVKCSTGLVLNPHLVDVLFKIFDANGDNKLSYSEFIEIMTDRLHRGFRSYKNWSSVFGWKPLKNCMIHELSTF